MVYWIKRKYRQIERTLSFLPLIWKGYDWDYRYAIDLFQHQLKRTEKSIRENGNHVGNQNTASRIKTAIRLMDKVYEEDYSLEYVNKLEQLYGINVLDWDGVSVGKDRYELKYEYEKWDNAKEINEMKKKLFKESNEKQKRAHKLLWDFIEHNIQHWWD